MGLASRPHAVSAWTLTDTGVVTPRARRSTTAFVVIGTIASYTGRGAAAPMIVSAASPISIGLTTSAMATM